MGVVYMLGKRFWKGLIVNRHRIAVGAAASRHGNPRQRSPCLVAFLGQSRNDSNGGVMLVEGIR